MIDTECFVLHNIKFKEYDRIYTLFTRKFGKIQARGRGVRKTTSKLGPHMQPLLPLSIQLVEGSSWYTITGVTSKTSLFPHFDEDYLELSTYTSEILKKTLPEHQENMELFDILEKVFVYIIHKKLPVPLSKCLFLVQYLKHTGHTIELFECLECGKKNTEFVLSVSHGGVLCTDCSTEKPTPTVYLQCLRILNDDSLEHIERILGLSEKGFQYLLSLLEYLFLQFYPVKLNTMK